MLAGDHDDFNPILEAERYAELEKIGLAITAGDALVDIYKLVSQLETLVLGRRCADLCGAIKRRAQDGKQAILQFTRPEDLPPSLSGARAPFPAQQGDQE